MYKDKALQKKTTKDRVRRYRALQKGVTEEVGVTPIIPLVINDPDDVPVIPKKYRDDLMSKESAKRLKALPEGVQRGIEDVLVARRRLGLFDDSEERIERATRYDIWNTGRLNARANILP